MLPASGVEPMYWSSFMTSSMQLAKECLSQKLTDDMGESFQPFEGLEKFAETIETGKLLLCFLAFSRFTSQILCKAMSFKFLLSQFWEESKWHFWTVFLESNTFQKILKLESLLRFESTSKFLTVSGTSVSTIRSSTSNWYIWSKFWTH